MRQKFNHALSTAALLNENTWSLKLKKIWDSHNHSLYNKEDDKYTVEGIKTYWEAVDQTIKYADTILIKRPAAKPKTSTQDKSNNNSFNNREMQPKNDQYHWNTAHSTGATVNQYPKESRSDHRPRSRSRNSRHHDRRERRYSSRSCSSTRRSRKSRSRTPRPRHSEYRQKYY